MSRLIEDLRPIMQPRARAFLSACDAEGIDLLVTCTLRTLVEQAKLYAQGRTKPGQIVTRAKPGQSAHNYGLALDVVPMRAGKPVWSTSGNDLILWLRVGELGEKSGLEWAGRWVAFREFPHFQFPGWREVIKEVA